MREATLLVPEGARWRPYAAAVRRCWVSPETEPTTQEVVPGLLQRNGYAVEVVGDGLVVAERRGVVLGMYLEGTTVAERRGPIPFYGLLESVIVVGEKRGAVQEAAKSAAWHEEARDVPEREVDVALWEKVLRYHRYRGRG